MSRVLGWGGEWATAKAAASNGTATDERAEVGIGRLNTLSEKTVDASDATDITSQLSSILKNTEHGMDRQNSCTKTVHTKSKVALSSLQFAVFCASACPHGFT